MTATFALPFLCLPDKVVTLGRWMIGQAGAPLMPIKLTLDGWDYAANIELLGSISIDMRAAANMLEIPAEGLKLAVTLKIGTGRGRFPRIEKCLDTRILDAATDQPTELRALLPGNTLSGRAQVRIDVLLAASTTSGSILSPSRIGSRLWSHETSVELEDGGDNRFPMEIVSFSQTFPSSGHVNAPWYLAWKPGGLAADFGGSIRLYINSDHQELTQRVISGDDLTLQSILGDVMVQMIAATLDTDDPAGQLSGCEEGSVGAQISAWLDLAFPRRSLSEIQNTRHSLPGHFHANIHAAAELGDIE